MGFTTAADRQRIDAFIRRGIRAGFCDKNMPSVSDLVEDADDVLCERAMRDKHHVLYYLFPDRKTELKYDLRPRRNEFTLSQKVGHLSDCNFITRLLYENCY